MHQTFYIDSEEEISSVVDRLNKSMSAENYFVVPKHALFLQSIVNLKLLKREADKVGKHVVLVTQDEIGSSMAQRSGIETRPTLEGLDSETIMQKENDEDHTFPSETVLVEDSGQDKKIRLSGVGSNDYYDAASDSSNKFPQAIKDIQADTRRIPINSIVSSQKNTRSFPPQENASEITEHIRPKAREQYYPSQNFTKPEYKKQLDPGKEKTIEKMFSRDEIRRQPVQPLPNETKRDRKIKKFFVGFILLCLLVLAGIAAYLFLPSAKISIVSNILKNKVDVDISAEGNEGKIGESLIPVRVIDKSESITLSNDVVGTSLANGKKAHGTIVIYNEFDKSDQTLIATTRFETPDGKIYRLVKNVVVPGTTVVGGQMKPGAITADIVADQPGSDYNIDPADFKIPGFSGSPKYDKFYAKSTEAINGGSSEGSSSGGAMSQRDIDSAKKKTEDALREKIAEKIAGELQPGEIALPQAEKITITKSSALAKVGDLTDTFDYIVQALVHVLVFSENDVKNVLMQSLMNSQQAKDNKQEITKIEYGSAEGDFEKNTLKLKVHGEVTLIPNMDIEKIKEELLGKKDDQLGAILKKYPAIKNINIEFWPSMVSRVPQYSQRVNVVIEND